MLRTRLALAVIGLGWPGAAASETPAKPAANLAPGFAGMGAGTSGGLGGATVRVSTGAELQAAIEAAVGPTVILVDGTVTPANSGDLTAITIAAKRDLSVIGAGPGADISGLGFHVKGGSSNLIFRNLRIHEVRLGPRDALGIEGPSRNIWVDHCEFYGSLDAGKDVYDGLLDVKRGAAYVSVTHSHFHDHHKVSLNGYSDEDRGERFITFAHNRFESVGSRLPLQRFGFAHIYENLYRDVRLSAINVRMGGVARIENNVFERVHDPIVSMDSRAVGYWDLSGNVMGPGVTWSRPARTGASAQDGRSTGSYAPPYAYTLMDPDRVAAFVLANAGVGRLGADAIPASPPPRP